MSAVPLARGLSGDEPRADPGRAGGLTKRLALLYSSGSIGAGVFYAFNNYTLPLLLKALGAGDLLIGLLSSTRSIEGAIIQPTVGALSDRVWTPLGRRRVFIAAGIPLSALFFVLTGAADSLLAVAILIVLFSLTFNAALDPYSALLADLTRPDERGSLSGVSNAIQLVSQVGFLVLIALFAADRVPVWSYWAVALVMLVSFGVTVVGLREPRVIDIAHGPRSSYVAELLAHHDAMRYLLAIFVFQIGVAAVQPYLVLFVTEDIGTTEQVALVLAATLLLLTAAGAVAFGKLADRVGTKPVLSAGWSLLAVAALLGLLVRDLPQTIAVVVIAGIGNGAATAVKWPLLTQLVPPQKYGVFAGLMAAADSIAIPLSIVIAAEVFLPRLSYRGMFVLLEVSMVLGLALLLVLVRVPAPRRVMEVAG